MEERIKDLESKITNYMEVGHISNEIERKVQQIEAELDKTVSKKVKDLTPNAISILKDTVIVPLNAWTFGIVSLTILIVPTIILGVMYSPEGRVESIMSAAVWSFSNNGATRDPSKEVSQILRIVTPHELTVEDLQKYPKNKLNLSDEEIQQRYSTNKETLISFGNDLKLLGAQGYTRWEGYGTATTPEKRQWVWNVTWAGKRVDPAKVVEAYKNRFNRSSGIYIEEFHVGETLHSTKK